jgi:PKD repeat protein
MIVFQNKSIGGETFEWDFGDGTTLPKPDTTRIEYTYESEGTYTVTLKAIDSKTCIGVDIATTTVYVYEKNTEIQGDGALCFGSSYTITSEGEAFFDWTTKDGSFEAHDELNEHTVMPKDTTMYYVTITEKGGCIRKDSVQLKVIPPVDVNFKWKKIVDCFSRPKLEISNLTKLTS